MVTSPALKGWNTGIDETLLSTKYYSTLYAWH
jgi:hypothetical protein